MKEENENGKSVRVKDKKFYLYVVLACVSLFLAATIIVTSVALAARNRRQLNNTDSTNLAENSALTGGTSGDGQANTPEDDEPVATTPEGFISPVSTMNVANEYGFYHNKTLNMYYEHAGVDLAAEAGTEVFAVAAGTVECVYTSDVLLGTHIVIDHGDGVKTAYDFVDAKEGLKAGDTLARGELIGTVAAANGKEYKDGAHLHFEVLENEKAVDPAKYLTFEEK